jgi:type IV pilus assembly protein PilB
VNLAQAPAQGEIVLVDSAPGLSQVLGAGEDRPSATHAVDLQGWLQATEEADEPSYQLAQRLSFPLVRLEHLAVPESVLSLLSSDLARRLRALPLAVRDGRIAVALEDPGDREAIETLEFVLPQRVVPLVASKRGMREAIARSYDRAEDEAMARQLGLDVAYAHAEPSPKEAERMAGEKPVVRVVDELIASAVARRASDIHLRPSEHGLDVLFRIDDEVVPVRRFMRLLQPAVVSRVKVLGTMNLAEHRRPQDGRRWMSEARRATAEAINS